MRHFPPAWQKSEDGPRLWRRLQNVPRSVLMLDYDGTLAPFHSDRLQAFPYPGVDARIRTLSQLSRVHLVLISGRPAAELRAFFPSGLQVEIWGNHGHEHLGKDGSYELLPLGQDQRQIVEEMKAGVKRAGFSQALEIKPASLAVHWRGLDSAGQEQIRTLVQSLFARYQGASRMQLLLFDGGLELRAIGLTKGTAVRQILAQEQGGIPAAYLGDDLTDEDAFAAIEGRGLSILVRNEPRESLAQFWLTPPEALLGFLDDWIHASSEAVNPSIHIPDHTPECSTEHTP